MSNFAFGTYRISDYNPQHIQALKEAIDGGIDMIDTSPNYTDGSAERAVGEVLKQFDADILDEIEIIGKFGYIQGENLQKYKGKSLDEVVKYSQDCYHCISKEFMQEQLALSLSIIGIERFDCYMIQNPEYYLLDALKKGVAFDERLDEINRRIFDAFVALEEQVSNQTILSYGISSNNFSLPSSSEEFLPYEDLIDLATRAAKYVGNKKHSFSTIELPINLLETEGLKCAKWAKKNGLRVFANRPLNTTKDGMMFRLADYNESHDYYNYLNELMQECDNEELESLYNLLDELDASKTKFGWIGDYDNFFFSQIIPHIRGVIDKFDEQNKEAMVNFIDMFFQEYRKMVSYECSKTTRKQLANFLNDCTDTLQKCAIDFLQKQKVVDYILVGMRKPSYVHEILAMKNTQSD